MLNNGTRFGRPRGLVAEAFQAKKGGVKLGSRACRPDSSRGEPRPDDNRGGGLSRIVLFQKGCAMKKQKIDLLLGIGIVACFIAGFSVGFLVDGIWGRASAIVLVCVGVSSLAILIARSDDSTRGGGGLPSNGRGLWG